MTQSQVSPAAGKLVAAVDPSVIGHDPAQFPDIQMQQLPGRPCTLQARSIISVLGSTLNGASAAPRQIEWRRND
jgi:hypothetical protein